MRCPSLTGRSPLRKVLRIPRRCSWWVSVAVVTRVSRPRSSSVRAFMTGVLNHGIS